MNWIQNNLSTILAVLGFISANIITPLVRKIPHSNIWFQIIRALLSGCPKEFSPYDPPTTEVKSVTRKTDTTTDTKGAVGSSEPTPDAVGANGPSESSS